MDGITIRKPAGKMPEVRVHAERSNLACAQPEGLERLLRGGTPDGRIAQRRPAATLAGKIIGANNRRIWRAEFRQMGLRGLEAEQSAHGERRAEIQRLADHAIGVLNSKFSLINPAPPTMLVSPGSGRDQFKGASLPGTKTIIINTATPQGYLAPQANYLHCIDVITVNHEVVHYAREPLHVRGLPRFRQPIRPGTAALMHLYYAVEEGAADFVASSMLSDRASDVAANVIGLRTSRGIMRTYAAIRAGASSSSISDALIGYILPAAHARPPGFLGAMLPLRISQESLYPEAHVLGAHLAMIMLAANGFDQGMTASKIMTSTNESLLAHIYSSVKSDEGRIKAFLSALRGVEEEVKFGFARYSDRRDAARDSSERIDLLIRAARGA